MSRFGALLLTTAAIATLGELSTIARAGIVIDNSIVTPVEDPHYNLFFDMVIQPGTLLTFGDSIIVGPVPYIDPITAANLQNIVTPFLGPWAGRFIGTLLPAPNRNVFKYTYVDTTPFLNDTPDPIHISRDLLGLGFGIFTIDMGPLTPTLIQLLTQTLFTESSTSDPNEPSRKIITLGSTTPIIVPEPSTLSLCVAALSAAGVSCLRRRRPN